MRLDHIGRGRDKAISDRTALRAQLRWHASLPNRPLRTRRGWFPTKLAHSSTRMASLRDAWLALVRILGPHPTERHGFESLWRKLLREEGRRGAAALHVQQ